MKIIDDAISEHIKDSADRIAEKFDCRIVSMETDRDHIHVLFKAKPQIVISKFINSFKNVSSRMVRKNHDNKFLWSRSYCLLTSGQVSINVLKRYIDSQGKK
jgi:putative transposase